MVWSKHLSVVGLVGELFNNVERKPFFSNPMRAKPYCGKYTMYSCQSGKFWRARCGQRSCGRFACRESYATKRQNKIQALCEDNGLNRFFTLTLDPREFRDDMEAWERISHIWSKFRKRLARAYPKAKWVCVLEKHREGEGGERDDCDEQEEANNRPHIHGYSSCWIDTVWMDGAWRACGGGTHTHIKYVWGTPEDYVCKDVAVSRYSTKDMLEIGEFIKPYQKIFWKSRGLVERDKKVSEGYGFVARQIVGLSGKVVLAMPEICDIINGNIREKHKGVRYYEERQVWIHMETTLGKVSPGRIEKGESVLAPNGGRPGEDEKSEGTKGPKDQAECRDQKAHRQITFEDWGDIVYDYAGERSG